MNYEELILNLLSDISGLEIEELEDNKELNLFESGIIDSLSLTSMLNSLEEELGKTITITEYCIEDFATVNSIVKVIEEL